MYKKTNANIWQGRTSNQQLYLHEKIQCIDLNKEQLSKSQDQSFAILGYACDEGVQRNSGRVGAATAPDVIRKMMASLSNHFKDTINILDIGNVYCMDKDLEKTQSITSNKISELIENKYFTIILGGGHDLAYAHFNGIHKQYPDSHIGIINLDAHFDLRKTNPNGNSGTPFYQIAKRNDRFKYLCLGIQEASNHRELYSHRQ